MQTNNNINLILNSKDRIRARNHFDKQQDKISMQIFIISQHFQLFHQHPWVFKSQQLSLTIIHSRLYKKQPPVSDTFHYPNNSFWRCFFPHSCLAWCEGKTRRCFNWFKYFKRNYNLFNIMYFFSSPDILPLARSVRWYQKFKNVWKKSHSYPR